VIVHFIHVDMMLCQFFTLGVRPGITFCPNNFTDIKDNMVSVCCCNWR